MPHTHYEMFQLIGLIGGIAIIIEAALSISKWEPLNIVIGIIGILIGILVLGAASIVNVKYKIPLTGVNMLITGILAIIFQGIVGGIIIVILGGILLYEKK
jgi:hypothetical protein